jgi:hypothetical protein
VTEFIPTTTPSLDLVISQQQATINENIQGTVEGVTSIVPMDNGRPAGTRCYSNWPLTTWRDSRPGPCSKQMTITLANLGLSGF